MDKIWILASLLLRGACVVIFCFSLLDGEAFVTFGLPAYVFGFILGLEGPGVKLTTKDYFWIFFGWWLSWAIVVAALFTSFLRWLGLFK